MSDENDDAVVEPTGNKKPRTHGELMWTTIEAGGWGPLVPQPPHADQAAARKWLGDKVTAGAVPCRPYALLRVVATVNPSIRTVNKAVF